MVPADLLLGFLLTKLFDNNNAPAQRPVSVPTPQPVPVPVAVPVAVPPGATAEPTPPAFPSTVTVPPPTASPATPAPHMKKAVEVWQVRPELASGASNVIVGQLGGDALPAVGAMTVKAFEQQFPKGWQACKVVTANEIAQAKALLSKWRDGGVVFLGPATLSGRRAYRMTQHPAAATTAPPTPVATPATPAAPPAPATPPATPSFPTQATTTPAATPAATATPSALASGQVTTVRRGEGLAQVAQRLGRPPNATSAKQLRAANVPQGPEAQWSNIDLAQGGIKRAGRAGGLQPGDRLFVPAAWGTIDPGKL